MLPPEELINFIETEDNFLIATHINPDGDGIGSSIALSMSLQVLGKKTVLLCKDLVPGQYKFLPGNESFYTLEQLKAQETKFKDYKNLILVDCNDLDRISDSTPTLNYSSSAVIDHHASERPFGNIRWVVPDAAATGLMIYYLIKRLGIKLTYEMAVNLYAAIAVDTGNFRYENTTSSVLRVASDLIDAGARPYVIYRHLFEAWSEGRFNLFMQVLNTLEKKDKIAIVKVTRKMFEDTSTSAEDTEHFVEFLKIMADVDVSVLFREIDDTHYKISLRSKDDIDVAIVAEAFGGGGHKNAAGCRIKADFETAKKELIGKIKQIMLN
ncbi:exopolyphosphatase-related protein [Dissulfurispira thermophila]|uniref:Exopolyphosphatase-related protein n=1 Tax=Dissulfurispira thermophila TaxID=2715679 RepID=A0A7G1GZX7_9BACT|nr:bifunctional oligoribonuclease/PAP phosphatase NrnA [Dissulfurispira thermophila]BCB95559.1 exopolyphosphatase-related protein [Dissulfurispira thermophila]